MGPRCVLGDSTSHFEVAEANSLLFLATWTWVAESKPSESVGLLWVCGFFPVKEPGYRSSCHGSVVNESD